MQCKKCQAFLSDGATVCGNCGTPVESSSNVVSSNGVVTGQSFTEQSNNGFRTNIEFNQTSSSTGIASSEAGNGSTMSADYNTSAGFNPALEETVFSPINNGAMMEPRPSSTPVVGPDPSTHPKKTLKDTIVQHKKILSMIGIIVIVLILVGFFAFKFLNRGPKYVVDKSIDQLFTMVEHSLQKDDTATGSMTMKPTILLEDSSYQKITDIINKLSIQMDYKFDKKEKVLALELQSDYDNSTLVDMNTYLQDQQLYVYLPRLYDKYVAGEIDEKEFNKAFATVSYDDMKIALQEFKVALKKVLKKEYFNQEKTSILVDGKNTKVIKSTLGLDFKQQQSMKKELLTNLKNNKKFIASYARVSSVSESEACDMLDEKIDDLQYNYDDGSKIEISVYTSGLFHDFKGISMKQTSEYSKSELSLVRDQKNNYSYKMAINGSDIVTGTFNWTGKKQQSDGIFVMKMKDIGKVTLKFSHSHKQNTKVSKQGINNTIKMDELTDTETDLILKRLQENNGVKVLVKEVQALIDSYQSSYNDYYSSSDEFHFDSNFDSSYDFDYSEG